MQATMDPRTRERASTFHFQMYGPAETDAVRWRLLSGNNRDMGRGVLVYRDPEACRAGIAEILRRIDELEPAFVPESNNSWRWALRYRGEPIVMSGHPYDRKVRCREGYTHFLEHAPDASVKPVVVISSARRWTNGAVIDLREPAASLVPSQRAMSPIVGRILR
jgi:uncharacterized protein YegP (UPF0339 family)